MPDVYRVRVPLPNNPLKEVNSYVFTSPTRSAIIDTGLNRPECRDVFEMAMRELGVDLGRTDFFLTHLHGDHQALLPSLLREGSRAFMGAADAEHLMTVLATPSSASSMGGLAVANGFPSCELRMASKALPMKEYFSGDFTDYIHILDGDTFEIGDYTLEAIHTPGHTPGHMAFYLPENKVVFSGDHVLGDITPNNVTWSDAWDPLAAYIESLEKVCDLDVRLCMPGHRSPITDFRARCLELAEHHRVRANEALAAVRDGAGTAYDVAGRLTWSIRADSWESFPVGQKWFAVGETISHLLYLVNKDLLRRRFQDDVFIYEATDCDIWL